MIELTFNNDVTTVSGDYSKSDLDIITKACSYIVPNADWSEKYQSKVWDGTISLFKKYNKSFPSGLLQDVESALSDNNIKFKIVDSRPLPTKSSQCEADFGDLVLRDYQLESIELVREKTRGILALCTAAGKTKTSCGIISDLSTFPVFFVVPSVSLLKQTYNEFKEILKPTSDTFSIGKLGGGEFILADQGVNVATYHTILGAYNKKYSESKKKIIDDDKSSNIENLMDMLAKMKIDLEFSPQSKHKSIKSKIKKVEKDILLKQQQISNKKQIRELLEECQLLIFDETHIAAEVIECLSLKCKKAYYKIGLTATPYRKDNQDKRMFGATGPIIKSVTASELILRGFLSRPYIYQVDLSFINKAGSNYQETYKKAIVENSYRNDLIKDFAEKMKAEGRSTLILIDQLAHGKILEETVEGCLFVPGKDGVDDSPIDDEELDYRKRQLDKLEKNEIIMAATSWASTGIDAPKISCIIFGGTVQSPSTVIQQIGRGLRKSEGKEDCIIIDFKMGEKSLRNHSNERLKTFKTEPEFSISMLKYKPGLDYSIKR